MAHHENIATAEGRAPCPAALAGEVFMTASLASLAAQMGLDPLAAVALPATIDCAAGKAGMAPRAMIAECEINAPLRDYLAGICRSADVAGALS